MMMMIMRMMTMMMMVRMTREREKKYEGNLLRSRCGTWKREKRVEIANISSFEL
tara:strand:- start:289 stop:450 length:162 start_codon:yes stop_codon:yes gene_type:complete